MRTKASLAALAVFGLLFAFGCDDDPDRCRFDPGDCFGGIGGFCGEDDDCDTGHCCTEEANCGGGMCTYSCDRDEDCPDDMGCEHHTCFFGCVSDDDCADGMSCEHDNTVCEWP